MTWFLVMVDLYIGPFNEIACKQAAIQLLQQAQCKQADYMYACDVDGKPGVYLACPHFTFPQVMIK